MNRKKRRLALGARRSVRVSVCRLTRRLASALVGPSAERRAPSAAFLCVLCVFMVQHTAAASPALHGFTGALTTPSALSQAFQSGALGLAVRPERVRLYLNYGIFETGEVTVSGTPLDFRLHAKYTWRPQGPHSPGVAVGVAELFGGAHQTSLYLVAGGALRARAHLPGLRLAAGVATRGLLRSVFASAELPVARPVSLIGEWNGHLNGGARVDVTAEIRVLLGVVNDRAALGISYDIGL
jgi:hypothetical protein